MTREDKPRRVNISEGGRKKKENKKHLWHSNSGLHGPNDRWLILIGEIATDLSMRYTQLFREAIRHCAAIDLAWQLSLLRRQSGPSLGENVREPDLKFSTSSPE